MNKPKNPYDESWLIRRYSQERYKNSVYLPEQEFVGRQNGWQEGADEIEAYKDEYFEAFRQEQNKEFQALKKQIFEEADQKAVEKCQRDTAKAATLKALKQVDNHLTLILAAKKDYMDRIFLLSDYRLKLKDEIERLEKEQ